MLSRRQKQKIRRCCGDHLENLNDERSDVDVLFVSGFAGDERLEALEYASSLAEDPSKAFACDGGRNLLNAQWYGWGDHEGLDVLRVLMKHGADPFMEDEYDESAYDRVFGRVAFEMADCNNNGLLVCCRLMREFSQGLAHESLDVPEMVIGQKLRAVAVLTDEERDPDADCRKGRLVPGDAAVIFQFEKDDLVYSTGRDELFCDNAFRKKYSFLHERPCGWAKGMIGRRLRKMCFDTDRMHGSRFYTNRYGLDFGNRHDCKHSLIIVDRVALGESFLGRIRLKKRYGWQKQADVISLPLLERRW